MTAVDEVAATDMQANVHVCRAFRDAVVVKFDVSIQHLVSGFGVQMVFLPAREHLFRTEVCDGESDTMEQLIETSYMQY